MAPSPDCLHFSLSHHRKTAFSPGPGDEDCCSWKVLTIFKKDKHNGDTVEFAEMRFLPIDKFLDKVFAS